MFDYLSIIILCLLFYVIIPIGGAFAVRKRWRRFRDQLYDSLDAPIFEGKVRAAEDFGGAARVFGTLEGLEDNDKLWVRCRGSSIVIDMEGAFVHTLPAESEFDAGGLRVTPMQRIPWKRAGVLTEGLGVFAYGTIDEEVGLTVLRGTKGQGPLVVFYEGGPDGILSRCLWSGRQRNEYWNDMTLPCLLVGSAALFLVSMFYFQRPAIGYEAVFSLCAALLPFSPLLPPGILLFLLYRHFWRDGRALRAFRELLLLGPRIQAKSQGRYEHEHYHDDTMLPMSALELPVLAREREATADHQVWRGREALDPFLETIVVHGQHDARAKSLLTRVHRYEFGALCLFGLSMVVNQYFVLLMIIQLINSV